MIMSRALHNPFKADPSTRSQNASPSSPKIRYQLFPTIKASTSSSQRSLDLDRATEPCKVPRKTQRTSTDCACRKKTVLQSSPLSMHKVTSLNPSQTQLTSPKEEPLDSPTIPAHVSFPEDSAKARGRKRTRNVHKKATPPPSPAPTTPLPAPPNSSKNSQGAQDAYKAPKRASSTQQPVEVMGISMPTPPRGDTPPQAKVADVPEKCTALHSNPPATPPKPLRVRQQTSPTASSPSSSGLRHERSESCLAADQMSTPSTAVSCNSDSARRSRSNSNSSSGRQSEQREDTGRSILNRGRPNKKTEAVKIYYRSQERSTEDKASSPLPLGMSLNLATAKLGDGEIDMLMQQVKGQAQEFQVMTYEDVKTLSQELRALDECCDYLRKTYNSLRDGKKKYHARMIAYLESSRSAQQSCDKVLAHQQAITQLDISIDEWQSKLNDAEHRRFGVRQKLLEHFTAVSTLRSLRTSSPTRVNEQTPPRSPEDVAPHHRRGQRGVDSNRNYTGSEVHSLLSEIEQEIEKMAQHRSSVIFE